MVEEKKSSLAYYKDDPHWSQTIYITGLPRSGKSTLLSIIGSCKNTEYLEEPFDLTQMAQKGSCFAPGSGPYKDYLDSFMASMENTFSELSMGRIYNFRKKDHSYILNIKSKKHIINAHRILRRQDLLKYLADRQSIFAITFNDIENAFQLITEKAPKPSIVFLKRDVKQVAAEIAEKGWLQDKSLEKNENLTPAYKIIRNTTSNTIFVPYIIDESSVELFLSLNNFNRSLMYTYLQEKKYNEAIANLQNSKIEVEFSDLRNSTRLTSNELFDKLNLVPTSLTKNIIKAIAKRKQRMYYNDIYDIDKKLTKYLINIGEV